MPIWTRLMFVVIAGTGLMFAMSGRRETQAQVRKLDKKFAAKVQAVADLLAQGKSKDATKKATLLAKGIVANDELYDMMNLLNLRSKAGWGFGDKVVLPVREDGVERLLQSLARTGKPAAFLAQHKKSLMQMAWRTAAVGKISEAAAGPMAAARAFAKRKPMAKWIEFSKQMQSASTNFLEAVSKGNPRTIKQAAVRLDASCNSCHSVFRD